MRRYLSLLLTGLMLGTTPAFAQSTTGTVRYYHTDAVGSVRMVTDAAGNVVASHDYMPFGEEPAPAADPSPLRFTGKERDTETGLDYFGARFVSSRQGRFTSTDPLTNIPANLADPQAWNRYTYALNNPIRYRDPNGRCVEPTTCTLEFGGLGFLVGGPPGALIGGVVGGIVGLAAIGTIAVVGTKIYNNYQEDHAVPPSAPTIVKGINAPINAFQPKVKVATDKAAGGLCEYCGVQVTQPQKSKKGVTPSQTERQTDHYVPGAGDNPENAANSCRKCNREKSDTKPEGTKWELERMKKKPDSSIDDK